MKKYILSLLTLLILTLSLSAKIKADTEETYVTLKTFETEEGDTIQFDRSNLYNYRVIIKL